MFRDHRKASGLLRMLTLLRCCCPLELTGLVSGRGKRSMLVWLIVKIGVLLRSVLSSGCIYRALSLS
jgi:hypothetical protein